MPKATRKSIRRKGGKDEPPKPRDDFPLFPHARGYWAKKVNGKTRYFGKIADDPAGEKAIILWHEQKNALLAGRTPRVKSAGLTVRDLCNRFLTSKQHKLDSGELVPATLADYHASCARMVAVLGAGRLVADLEPANFQHLRAKMAKGWGPVTLGNEIQRIRVVFRYAVENQLVARQIRFGSEFKKPSKKALRQARLAKGPRTFEADELRRIVAAASVPMKAMVLLGINCGYGNTDIATLPIGALNPKTGWARFPRPKTAVPRRCVMWPETLAAIKAALAERRKPADPANAGLVFITKYGGRWGRTTIGKADGDDKIKVKVNADDPVCKEFSKLLTKLELKRPGISFYALRHTFETIGGEARDQVAVDHIMGHSRDDMASVYRERISDERLKAVTDYVHQWLFGTDAKAANPEEPSDAGGTAATSE